MSVHSDLLANIWSSLIVSAGILAIWLSDEYPDPKSSTLTRKPYERSWFVVLTIVSVFSIKTDSTISNSIRNGGILYFFWRAIAISVKSPFVKRCRDTLTEIVKTSRPSLIQRLWSSKTFSIIMLSSVSITPVLSSTGIIWAGGIILLWSSRIRTRASAPTILFLEIENLGCRYINKRPCLQAWINMLDIRMLLSMVVISFWL